MGALSQVEKISEKYAVSAEEFIRSGVITNLRLSGRSLVYKFLKKDWSHFD